MKKTQFKNDVVRTIVEQQIENFARLGREIKVSPKANVSVNKAGYSKKYFVPSIQIIIGIGNDHIANLTMDIDSWKALKGGAEISITTTEDFKRKINV